MIGASEVQATAATGPQLDREFVEDWARRYLDAWNAHEPDAVASLCTEDVIWTDPSLAGPAHGRAGVCAFVQATARTFPDFHVEESEPPLLSAIDPRALGPYRLSATMLGDWEASNFAATGAHITVVGVDEWTFRGELMCNYASYYDTLDLARQLGILPAAGSTVEQLMARLQHGRARIQRRHARRR
jgi:SnoaL-like domain